MGGSCSSVKDVSGSAARIDRGSEQDSDRDSDLEQANQREDSAECPGDGPPPQEEATQDGHDTEGAGQRLSASIRPRQMSASVHAATSSALPPDLPPASPRLLFSKMGSHKSVLKASARVLSLLRSTRSVRSGTVAPSVPDSDNIVSPARANKRIGAFLSALDWFTPPQKTMAPMKYGFELLVADSVAPAHMEAIAECVAQVGPQKLLEASLVVVAASPNYDTHALVLELQARCGPAVEIFGVTTAGGVITQHRVAMEEKQWGMGIMCVIDHDPDSCFGVGMAEAEDIPLAEAVERAAEIAIRRSGLREKGRWCEGNPDNRIVGGDAVVLLSTRAMTGGRRLPSLVEAVRKVFGNSCLIGGGVAGESPGCGPRVMIATSEQAGNSEWGLCIAILAVNREVSIFSACDMFMDPSPVCSGKITKLGESNQKVVTINDRPATEVISEWTGVSIAEPLAKADETGEAQRIYHLMGLKLCGRVIKKPSGQVGIAACVYESAGPGCVVTLGSNVEEGQELVLCTGTFDRCVDKFGTMGTRPQGQIIGAIPTLCCIGTLRADHATICAYRERYMTTKMGSQPFLMLIGLGEFGNVAGLGDMYHVNASLSEIMFARKVPSSDLSADDQLYRGVNTPRHALTIRPEAGLVAKLILGDHQERWRLFLESRFCEEMMEFWLSVEQFRNWRNFIEEFGIPSAQLFMFKREYDQLYLTFVPEGCPKQINLPAVWTNSLRAVFEKTILGINDIDVIFESQDEVGKLLKANCLGQFLTANPDLKPYVQAAEAESAEYLGEESKTAVSRKGTVAAGLLRL